MTTPWRGAAPPGRMSQKHVFWGRHGKIVGATHPRCFTGLPRRAPPHQDRFPAKSGRNEAVCGTLFFASGPILTQSLSTLPARVSAIELDLKQVHIVLFY
jgi:hypothetical protein